jgi:DNA-binding transcriptional MerR regulator
MNNIKNTFSIKDLENLSGIKAHTIRIWEKRYKVLEPMRTDTNIRVYDIHNLQKLLNITLLHNYGYKISKISKHPAEKIPALVNEIISEKNAKNHAITTFKLAMMNFDQTLFFKTYNDLLSEKSFRTVFHEVFIPLLDEVGLLWQTDTISTTHEHFITYLIKQKILINTEKIQGSEPYKNDRIFVLYLPENELHELGLMYLNYEIISCGYKTIFLGESVPLTDLSDIKRYFSNVTFVSYMTIEPTKEEVNQYITKFKSEILNDDETELWVLGRMGKHIDKQNINTSKIKIYHSLSEACQEL